MSRRILWVAATLAALLAPKAAVAEATPMAKRLIAKRDAERYEVATPHSSVKAGAARVHVRAPADVVRKVVTDFDGYSKHIKKFDKAKVVGRNGNKVDVYLQVPILKGLAKVWAIVRFEPIKKNGPDEEVLVGKMLKGNVKHLNAWWKIKKIDNQNTQLNLELLIVPDLPVPGSLVTGEVAYAADEAVMGLRNRSEKLQQGK